MMRAMMTLPSTTITLSITQINFKPMARTYRKFNKSKSSALSELKQQSTLQDLEYDEGFQKYKISGMQRWNRNSNVDFDDDYE